MPHTDIFEWPPEYASHHPEIDRQHQTWFRLADRVHQATIAGTAKE